MPSTLLGVAFCLEPNRRPAAGSRIVAEAEFGVDPQGPAIEQLLQVDEIRYYPATGDGGYGIGGSCGADDDCASALWPVRSKAMANSALA